MSWSLKLTNGDLALSGNSYAEVTGSQKLTQDLMCAIKTPAGTDDAHPEFGSIIDGGLTTDGIYHESVIGELNDATTAAYVEAEIRRVITDYQGQQLNRNRADGIQYGKTTLTPEEILVNLASLRSQAVQDALLVTATLQTGVGSVVLNVPVVAQ